MTEITKNEIEEDRKHYGTSPNGRLNLIGDIQDCEEDTDTARKWLKIHEHLIVESRLRSLLEKVEERIELWSGYKDKANEEGLRFNNPDARIEELSKVISLIQSELKGNSDE